MTEKIEKIIELYLEGRRPIFKLNAVILSGRPISSTYENCHKTILHIAVHKHHHQVFKTERGAKAWLARWEGKKEGGGS